MAINLKALEDMPMEIEKERENEPKKRNGSRSVEEFFISLLDFRFKKIIAEIEKKKNEPDELGRYKGINDADETVKSLAKLHGEIKGSLKMKEFTKAHELTNEFQNKLVSFYIYPLTLTQKRRYIIAPEPGQDRDYDNLTRTLAEVRESSKKQYPGPEVDSFLAAVGGAEQGIKAEAKAEPDYVVVRTFFASDRNLTGKTKPDEMFGVGRSSLTYGTCEVSIPRDHRMGELEHPSIWRLEFREDPTKHVVLLSTAISSKDQFFADVAARIRQFKRSSAFLFVHGYNVTFEDAARRTAQISYDLAFEGAPVFYSWPSKGTIPAYTVDEQTIEWAQANLRGFLEDFFTRSDAQSVYLIAHSMGNRALTRAVASLLTDKPALRNRLKEVILTAPDIDADVFKRDIAPALTETGRPVTLYASSEDLALVASKKVHGYPRAGDSGQGLVVVAGIETIDATVTDSGLVGHSYFAETRSVLSDMFYLIRNGQRADQRFGLRGIDTQVGRYWEFKR